MPYSEADVEKQLAHDEGWWLFFNVASILMSITVAIAFSFFFYKSCIKTAGARREKTLCTWLGAFLLGTLIVTPVFLFYVVEKSAFVPAPFDELCPTVELPNNVTTFSQRKESYYLWTLRYKDYGKTKLGIEMRKKVSSNELEV